MPNRGIDCDRRRRLQPAYSSDGTRCLLTRIHSSIIDRIMFQLACAGPEGIDLAVVPDAIWVRDADETVEDFIRRVRREARKAGFASFEVRGRYNTDEDEAPQGIREAA